MNMNPSRTVEELQRQLEEAERRREEAERRHEEEKRLRQEAEERLEPTTFNDFIQGCHQFLTAPLKIQSNLQKSTKGSITRPDGRLCPTYLREWKDFPSHRERLFGTVAGVFHPESSPVRVFESKEGLRALGNLHCRRPLASELDLMGYQRYAVEEHVITVIQELIKIGPIDGLPVLGSGVSFENHANTLTDPQSGQEEEDQEENQEEEWKPRSDQLCVFRKSSEAESLLYVIEYKAAHKLTPQNLRIGLKVSNFWEEVVQEPEIPTNRDEKLVYNAKKVTGAALTQTFDYMIKEGVEYGCLTTGESIVLLRIKKNDPSTLYYHLSEPSLDVESRKGHGFPSSATAASAVASILGLCFLALDSPQRDQKWRSQASSILNTWAVDVEYILAQFSADEKNSSPPASEYIPSTPDETPVKRRKSRQKCADQEAITKNSSSESSDDDDFSDNTPSKKQASRPMRKRTTTISSSSGLPPPPGKRRQQQYDSNTHESMSRYRGKDYKVTSHEEYRRVLESIRASASVDTSYREPRPDYCTQKCLAGLGTESPLDAACPNISLHQSKSDDGTHPISKLMVAELLGKQLNDDRDNGCKALNIVGTSGALFKMTLAPYGYTFVGKGTIKSKVRRLQHEAEVYQYLNKLQGTQIPVCLGSVNLNQPFIMNNLDYIVHFLLLSWGGKDMEEATPSSCDLHEVGERFKKELRRYGVEHGDICAQNVLWSVELNNPVLIDFDQAQLMPKKRPNTPYLIKKSPLLKKRRVE